jgi:hypothetical protein
MFSTGHHLEDIRISPIMVYNNWWVAISCKAMALFQKQNSKCTAMKLYGKFKMYMEKPAPMGLLLCPPSLVRQVPLAFKLGL